MNGRAFVAWNLRRIRVRKGVSQERLAFDADIGGMDRTTKRLLRQLMDQFAKNSGRIVLPRRIKPGSHLIREWKGERHQVTVLEDGFTYQGKPYESLSQIARLITGTRWNGPKFFGLRANGDSDHGR